MDRLEFLQKMAAAGLLVSCGCSFDKVAPVPDGGGTKLDVTIDITLPQYKALLDVGGYAYHDTIIVGRFGVSEFFALSKKCPHEGFDVQYEHNNNRLFCLSFHGGSFDKEGAVLSSPPVSALKKYKTEYDGVKNLRIFE